MKQAQLKSFFIATIISLFLLVIVYAANNNGVLLNYPSGVWVTTNSVNFNFTANSSVATLSYCALYANNSGTMALKANYTNVANGTPQVSGISINDSNQLNTWGWNVTCNNGTADFSATVANFGVDGAVPSVTLDSPANAYYSTTASFIINFTPTDTSNPLDCDVSTNLSGSWAVNQTARNWVSGSKIGFNVSSAGEGQYKWGVSCNDSASNRVYSQNRTFIVDTLVPDPIRILAPLNATFSGNVSPLVRWNQTNDANFDKYILLVSSNSTMYNPFMTLTISTITLNSTVLSSSLGDDKSYYIQIQAYDLAGSYTNSTQVNYTLDTVAPIVFLNTPLNNTFLADNTPDFNVTVNDSNPNSCTALLSTPSSSTLLINSSEIVITNGTQFNITPFTMNDGVYKFNIECNDSVGRRVNASTAVLQTTIDTILPTAPYIISTFHQTNSTNKIPNLLWGSSLEVNFSRYWARAYYKNNNSIAYEINITSQTINYTRLNLSAGYNYSFNVTIYDLAGNFNSSGNTTNQTLYYVDPICGVLNSGWNVCGAVWTSPKSLSLIANETGANQVAVFNSSHQFATCNAAESKTGQNCKLTVNISSPMGNNLSDSVYDTSINHVVFVYVNSTSDWNNRTWGAVQSNANMTLTNASGIGWQIEAMWIRSGRVFGHIKDRFTTNVSMMSLDYNNGSKSSYVNNGLFRSLNNNTRVEYGRAYWIFYNRTNETDGSNVLSNSTIDIGVW